MKNSKDLLGSILKTTQMGQVGIRTVLGGAMRPTLRKALESQLQEYDAIETEAHAIAAARGWELTELAPGVRILSGVMAKTKLAYGNTDSKIAGMMIQGNTRGLIKGLKNERQLGSADASVSALSRKLLDCESANIRQMQGFL